MMVGSGEATLVGGTVTVPLPRIPANAVVVLTAKNWDGTVGSGFRSTVIPRVGFTISSASALDKSVVGYTVTV